MSKQFPNKEPIRVKNEVADIRIISVEFSGDGEGWATYQQAFGGQEQGGFPHLLSILQSGDRVLVRTIYEDIYKRGNKGLPKSGPIYELRLVDVEPMRRLIEAPAAPAAAELPASTDKQS